jgi:hypothetical protein
MERQCIPVLLFVYHAVSLLVLPRHESHIPTILAMSRYTLCFLTRILSQGPYYTCPPCMLPTIMLLYIDLCIPAILLFV